MLLIDLLTQKATRFTRDRKETDEMMVECERSLPLLSDLRDGILAETDVVWVRAHLDGCVGCKEIFQDIDSIVLTALTLRSDNGLAYPDEELLWQRIGGKRTIH